MAQSQIPTFVCPADNPYRSENTIVAIHQYLDTGQATVVQAGGMFPDQKGNELGRTNYLGIAGTIGYTGSQNNDYYRGIFTNRSENRPEDITDGSSNTLMFGENSGGKANETGSQRLSFAWFGCGSLGTYWGLEDDYWVNFSSRHPGGVVQFCLADGSVRPLTAQIDIKLLKGLSGMQDHEIVTLGD